jgi:hypothetical protein
VPLGIFLFGIEDLIAEDSEPFFAGVSFYEVSSLDFIACASTVLTGFAGVIVDPVCAFLADCYSCSYLSFTSSSAFFSSSFYCFSLSSIYFLRSSGSPLMAFLSMSNVLIVFLPFAFASSAAFFSL